jgi:hypothetical protein
VDGIQERKVTRATTVEAAREEEMTPKRPNATNPCTSTPSTTPSLLSPDDRAKFQDRRFLCNDWLVEQAVNGTLFWNWTFDAARTLIRPRKEKERPRSLKIQDLKGKRKANATAGSGSGGGSAV